mmetsp:Transcript_26675/g.47270  ORF Transcript_26675/g.47270 Transcript_26675/m.47270 type:complete len:218 (-) Transcript_26675:886-1539(-)
MDTQRRRGDSCKGQQGPHGDPLGGQAGQRRYPQDPGRIHRRGGLHRPAARGRQRRQEPARPRQILRKPQGHQVHQTGPEAPARLRGGLEPHHVPVGHSPRRRHEDDRPNGLGLATDRDGSVVSPLVLRHQTLQSDHPLRLLSGDVPDGGPVLRLLVRLQLYRPRLHRPEPGQLGLQQDHQEKEGPKEAQKAHSPGRLRPGGRARSGLGPRDRDEAVR